MKNIWNVMKKDLDKVFKFPRMFFSTIILPGLILFVIYALLGTVLQNALENTDEVESNVYVYNAPVSFQKQLEEVSKQDIKFHTEFSEDLETLKNSVLHKEIEAIIIFDENFDTKIAENQNPQISLFFNPDNAISSKYEILSSMVATYKANLIEDILKEHGKTSNIFSFTPQPLFDEKKSGGIMLAMLLPMLIVIFIFSSSLGIGTDAIAGEKDRGTLATLLMAPIKRNHIIFGKIFSTTIISTCSAISSFIGILASMPFAKQMYGFGDAIQVGYQFGDYMIMLGLLFLLAVLASTLILLCSTFAKTVKEANSYAMPIYLVAMIASMISMVAFNMPTSIAPYFIPIYNVALGIKGILSYNVTLLPYLAIFFSTILFISLIVFLLIKLFKSEKIVFSK